MKSSAAKGVVLALVCSLSLFAAKRTIDITSYDYLPFNGHSLKEDGAITKLTAMVFEKAGYTVKVTHRNDPWARILTMAQAGEFDALVSVWDSKEREAFLATTDPLINNDVGFFKLAADALTATSLKEVVDLKASVGFVRGYALPKALTGVKLPFDDAESDATLVKKLLIGRDRLILSDKAVATYYANKQGPDEARKMQWLFSVESLPLRTGVVKTGKPDWAAVVKDYNQALAALAKDGTVARVCKEYGLR